MIHQTIIPFIVVGYVIQLVELVFFPLPSDFTTYNIIQKQTLVFTNSKSAIAILILGTTISVVTFLIPGLLILFPEGQTLFHYINLDIAGIQILLVFFILFGSSLTLIGVLQISNLKRFTSESGLIQSGIFRFTRNPITLGLNAIVIGFFLALPAIELLGGSIIYIINAHFRVRMEEKQLQSKYDKEFQQYKNSVPRYIAFKPVFNL